MSRLAIDERILSKMITYYCQKIHRGRNLCDDCDKLLKYSIGRLDLCKFGNDKPVCSACKVHCYRKNEREKIRQVMRFAGPRMIFINPYIAIIHFSHKYSKKTKQIIGV
jgi:Nitrous oxide-stimulated promoter